MALSPAQVAALAWTAGFRGNSLVIALATAIGESGLNPTVLGDTTITTTKWGPSVGLWQIRSLNAQRGTGEERDATRLTDPSFNARSAFAISNHGKDFTPWSVFKSGAYKQHLGQAQGGVDQLGVNGANAAQLLATVMAPDEEDDPMPALNNQEQRELLDLLRNLEQRSKETFHDISGNGRLKEAVLAARWLLGTGSENEVTAVFAASGDARNQLKTLLQGALLDGLRAPSDDHPDRGTLREPLKAVLREVMAETAPD